MYVRNQGHTISCRINNNLWMRDLIENYAKVDKVRICPVAPHRKNRVGYLRTATTGRVWPNGAEIKPATREPRWTGSYGLNGWMDAGGWTVQSPILTTNSKHLPCAIP
jgi:hypothetical protein